MASEKVRIVQETTDAINRRDWDGALRHAAADFEMDLSRALSHLRGVYRRDDMGAYWDEYTADWESIRLEPQEYIEIGDHVVVPTAVHGVGRDGIEVDARICTTYTFSGGTISRICMHQDREDALKELGIDVRSS